MSLRKLKDKKKPKSGVSCKDKIELALKEVENLSQEAKNFFVVDDKKENKDGSK